MTRAFIATLFAFAAVSVFGTNPNNPLSAADIDAEELSVGTTLGPNLVANPSFEEVGGDGELAGAWSQPGLFTVTDTVARSGSRSVEYDNPSPERYGVLSFPLDDIEVGDRFYAEAWVKTDGEMSGKGRNLGAMITIEYWDDQDNYLRGAGRYSTRVEDSDGEWVKIAILSEPVAAFMSRGRVGLYCYKGSFGRAWFDDVAVHRVRGPLVDALETDAYRGVVSGRTMEVRAGLRTRDFDVSPDALDLVLEVIDSDGDVLAQHEPADFTPHWASFDLDTATLPEGDYTLRARGSLPGGPSATATTRIERVSELPERRVWIDEHRRAIVDGKPFFPIGVYFGGAASEKQLRQMADAGINCIMPYGSLGHQREHLDRYHEHGVHMLFSFKDVFAHEPTRAHRAIRTPKGIRTARDASARVQSYVARYSDHPAIVAWYVFDEPLYAELPRLIDRQELLERIDPDHPTWGVHNFTGDLRRHLPALDVVGIDPYPLPGVWYADPTRVARYAFDETLGIRPIWAVPQMFKRRGVAPTPEQFRAFVWECIANGATGIVPWTYARWPQKDGVVAEEHWSWISAVTRELASFSPVLLSTQKPERPKYERVDEHVSVVSFADGGDRWVVAVNGGDEPRRATIAIPSAWEPVAIPHAEVGDTAIDHASDHASLNLKAYDVVKLRYRVP